MSLSVQRDPFARGEYRRECFTNTTGHTSCKWCGQKPKRLYSYTWVYASFREQAWRSEALFCTFQCYHGYYL